MNDQVFIEDDPDHPEGGHALVIWPGASTVGDAVTMILDPLDGQYGTWPRASSFPATATVRGLEVAVGPDVAEKIPAHTPMQLRVPEMDLSVKVQWPVLQPLWRPSGRRVLPTREVVSSNRRARPLARKVADTAADPAAERVAAAKRSEENRAQETARLAAERIAAEQRARDEAARADAETQARERAERLEAERIAADQRTRDEAAEHRAREDAARLAAEAKARHEAELDRTAQESRQAAETAAREREAWDRVADTSEIAPLRAFLKAWPSGAHAAQARARIEQLERAADAMAREREAWRAVDGSADAAALRAFLQAWPAGVHAAEAEAQLARLHAEDAQPAFDPVRARRAALIDWMGIALIVGGCFWCFDALVVATQNVDKSMPPLVGGMFWLLSGSAVLAIGARLVRPHHLSVALASMALLLFVAGLSLLTLPEFYFSKLCGGILIGYAVLAVAASIVLNTSLWRAAAAMSGVLLFVSIVFLGSYLSGRNIFTDLASRDGVVVAMPALGCAAITAALAAVGAQWRVARKPLLGLGGVLVLIVPCIGVYGLASHFGDQMFIFIPVGVSCGAVSMALAAHIGPSRAAKWPIIGMGIAVAVVGALSIAFGWPETDPVWWRFALFVAGFWISGSGIIAVALGLLLDYPGVLSAARDGGPTTERVRARRAMLIEGMGTGLSALGCVWFFSSYATLVWIGRGGTGRYYDQAHMFGVASIFCLLSGLAVLTIGARLRREPSRAFLLPLVGVALWVAALLAAATGHWTARGYMLIFGIYGAIAIAAWLAMNTRAWRLALGISGVSIAVFVFAMVIFFSNVARWAPAVDLGLGIAIPALGCTAVTFALAAIGAGWRRSYAALLASGGVLFCVGLGAAIVILASGSVPLGWVAATLAGLSCGIITVALAQHVGAERAHNLPIVRLGCVVAAASALGTAFSMMGPDYAARAAFVAGNAVFASGIVAAALGLVLDFPGILRPRHSGRETSSGGLQGTASNAA